ncbi:MAG: cytochrome P450 [Saprospiraceae bacterium]
MIPEYRGKGPLGAAFEFLKNPVLFTAQQEPKLGDFYRVKVPLRRIYVSTNPEVMKHVLQTHHRNYKKSPAYKELKLALGNGLVTSEGDYWFKQRRLAQPAFYKSAMGDIFETMVGVADRFCENLLDEATSEINISREMMRVTSDIVLKALFSVENEADSARMYQQILDTQEYIIDRTSHPYLIPFYHLTGRHRRFLKDRRDFDAMAYGFIKNHKEQEEPPNDFLTLLLQVRDADTGEGMSDQQVRDEAITIFAAGHETSANALTWILWLLTQHPEWMAKLRKEHEAILGDRLPALEDLNKLEITRRVIEEGMRMYPPAYALGREALVNDEIIGEPIPKGSILFLSIFAAQRSDQFWDQPLKFDPDRFLPERIKSQTKMTYMPFGAGPRMCIGNHFAMMEMQLLLTLLVSRFDFHYKGEGEPEYMSLITLKPKEDILMKVQKRPVVEKMETGI